MKLFHRSLVLLLTLSMPAFSNSLKVSFKKKESVVSAEAFKTLKPVLAKVVDPNESTVKKAAHISFRGYEGLQVLDLAFGARSNWAQTKEITFVCADGYRPSIKTADFLKGGFYFAISRDGTSDFSIVNNLKDGKKAELSPFYVVWDRKEFQTKEKGFYWPYQVVGLEVQ